MQDDILKGTMMMPPTAQKKYYTITSVDDSSVHDVAPSNLYEKNDVPSAGITLASLAFFRSNWLNKDKRS